MTETAFGMAATERDDEALARPFRSRSAILNYGFTGDETDLQSCTASIRRGSKSFHIASLILPRQTRRAAHALYAFCRHSDDIIDDTGRRPDALKRLRQRLDRIYEGRPSDHACDRAFARLVHDHRIPKGIPAALLDGFAMDVEDRHYRTIEEVKDYAAGVAATVGLMMSLVMGAKDSWTLARAADLGLAMQLTNIARDVGEDARNGRLYLPLEWLDEVGLHADAFLRAPCFSRQLAEVIKRLLAEADRHYALAHAGIEHLPVDCRHAIRTAALTYQDIGRTIVANGYDTVSYRARTTLSRKLILMMRAARPIALAAPDTNASTIDASVARLVAMAADAAAPSQGGQRSSPNASARVERFTSIMIELQRRSREDRRLRRLERWERAGRLA
ncbi:phytoene/squalene synthase family protein [Ciceribacter sp. L1K23]|uniref:phytoene/squalene synthase family protein n=1 Tax=Ciceribacter sp. L1K23 TaxID=2820276 RepID=UPI0020126999|nr:phytoene/squalene synthase family protein [Ciceribacter sp. L1K23]